MSQTMYNEDLFEGTKMTFGEHLEELRVCLVKALLGLLVGVLVGLLFATRVVKHIEGPLQSALENFHIEKTKAQLQGKYGDLPEELVTMIADQGLVFEDVFWEINEVRRLQQLFASKQAHGDPASGSAPKKSDVAPDQSGSKKSEPSRPTSQMVKMRIWRPMDADVTSLSAQEPFMIWMKAAMITGATLASPWIFWQLWSFVAAGLYPHEKHYVYFFLPASLGLFFTGASLAFFFAFQPILDFLFSFNRMMNIDPDPRISEWISFVLLLPLGFGISFQLPLVMLVLERLGIMTVQSYLDKWRIAVLVIFVVSMILTPSPDPFSMLLMAFPLTMLYFGGILLCRHLPRRTSPYGAGYDPQ